MEPCNTYRYTCVYELYDQMCIIDYRRAVTGVAIIGLCVAVAANVFTIYAIRRPRYVLRRLAGCLQVGPGETISINNSLLYVAAVCIAAILQAKFSMVPATVDNDSLGAILHNIFLRRVILPPDYIV